MTLVPKGFVSAEPFQSLLHPGDTIPSWVALSDRRLRRISTKRLASATFPRIIRTNNMLVGASEHSRSLKNHSEPPPNFGLSFAW
ncbi:hypothetical protein CPSG_09070 [Coccidioides posadasii str. Silveira]|uniref:Uncharacterized protein n=1 Tax=Coccidioides posadasii (strain RMSCC 757 / Silveira) TaxID=443226 RepID=E9DGX1_COCPS|nr:hypothetical protein CPSG_09070 [Coccidioides posadasii str. Silveira]